MTRYILCKVFDEDCWKMFHPTDFVCRRIIKNIISISSCIVHYQSLHSHYLPSLHLHLLQTWKPAAYKMSPLTARMDITINTFTPLCKPANIKIRLKLLSSYPNSLLLSSLAILVSKQLAWYTSP